MGRRTRRRAADAVTPKAKTKPRDHQARVSVSDDVWREFRNVVGNESIATYLGRLVERAVERDRARRIRNGTLSEEALLESLERAQEIHADLGAMVVRLERLLGDRRK
jgi:predicted CopG family antitoxin